MCSTPLIASSSGVPTVWASTVGFAPGYLALTVMVGGVTSGYSLIGSERIAIRPPASIASDNTTAKIGRSIKKREKRTRFLLQRVGLPGCRRRRGGNFGNHSSVRSSDLHPGPHAHQTIDHDALAGLESRVDDAEAINHPAQCDRAILDGVVVLEDEHELAILI